jgi:hypothetical protein
VTFTTTSLLDVLDNGGDNSCFIDLLTGFKYHGSVVCRSLTPDESADERIRSASPAFGALLTSKNIYLEDIKLKKKKKSPQLEEAVLNGLFP